tara:strand:- start:167 stop:883 length:717 start_codon:yes stop_codon:yes gene_type:complete
MSVLGFSAVNDAALKVSIDEDIEIQIASLTGIFILKVVAWRDRNHKTNKDADDMAFILQNYLEIHRDESLEYFEEIYTDDHTILKGGATLLGKQLNEVLNKHPEAKQSITEILTAEIEKKEESKLINQILETDKALSYEEVLKSIQNINAQITNLKNQSINMTTAIKETKDSTVLEDNQLLCVLTNQPKKVSAKETNLQSVILMLNEEYGFDLEDMERDFAIIYTDPETDKTKSKKQN